MKRGISELCIPQEVKTSLSCRHYSTVIGNHYRRNENIVDSSNRSSKRTTYVEDSSKHDAKSALYHPILDKLLSVKTPQALSGVSSEDPEVQKRINQIAQISSPIAFLNTLKTTDEKRVIVWRAFAEKSKQLVQQMHGDVIVAILHEFAQKRLRDTDHLLLLVEHIVPQLPALSTGSLVKFLWSLGRLRTRSAVAFKSGAREVAARATEMTGKQIGEVMFSYAILRYLHPHLHDVLRIQLIERSRALKPRDLTLALQSLSLLRLQKDRKLFASLVGQTNRTITEFSGPQLAAVLNSYANFNVRHPLCLDVISTQLFLKINNLTPMNVAAVVNASARLPAMKSGMLVTQLADKMTVEGQYYGLEAICLATAGFASLLSNTPPLRSRIKPLFEILGRRIGELSLQLQPRQVSSLVYSFARAEVRFGPLFYHAPIHLERFSSNYSCDSIAMIVRAYAKLDIRHGPIIEVLMNSIQRFIVPQETYPLCHLTVKYMEQRSRNEESEDLMNYRKSVDELSVSSLTMKKCESWNIQNSKSELKVDLAPARSITLVWILESFAQWNIDHRQILSIIADQLTMRSRELSPPLCVRALTAWEKFGRPDPVLTLALLDQISIAWTDFSRYEKSKTSQRKVVPHVGRLELDTAPVAELLGLCRPPTDDNNPSSDLHDNSDDVKFVSTPPLTWRECVILLDSVRSLGYRPKEVLPDSLLSYARRSQSKLTTGRTHKPVWDMERLVEDDIQRIEEDDKDELDKFDTLITKKSDEGVKKNRHAKNIHKLVGHTPCSKKGSWDNSKRDEWDFKIPDQIIPDQLKNGKKANIKKRTKLLDDLFGSEEIQTDQNDGANSDQSIKEKQFHSTKIQSTIRSDLASCSTRGSDEMDDDCYDFDDMRSEALLVDDIQRSEAEESKRKKKK